MTRQHASAATTTDVPDSRGLNLHEADPYGQAMADYYLPPGLAAHLRAHLHRLGALAGSTLDELAHTADQHPPTLSVRTRGGADRATVVKHPAYVELERYAYSEFGLAAMSHQPGVLGWPERMPALGKYALTYLFVQAEFGLCCPVSMTDSLARTLCRYGSQDLIDAVLPQVATQDFDALRQGAMFMTEQGAGSDVGATTTRATRQADGTWRLDGDKWFCSNPDAGFAMVLARSEDGPGLAAVSLFLLPRDLADGSRNAYRILRLKDKLGTRSMASGEIRLEGATAWLIGEPGRGFQQMADMINNSRLSNGVRAAGLMRRAMTEATFVARQRRAFGQRLIDMPLMQRQLMKLLVPTEQARSMVMQTARALVQADAGGDPSLARILTPLIKFRACRDARRVTGDAMEVRGGCGYIEEYADARLVRDAHLGSIWEGTSNIVALDVLRAVKKANGLAAIEAHVQSLLAQGVPAAPELADLQAQCLARAFALARRAADEDLGHLARQAATALYNVVTMAALRAEASEPALATRSHIADMVLLHRLAPYDPCGSGVNDEPAVRALIAFIDAHEPATRLH